MTTIKHEMIKLKNAKPEILVKLEEIQNMQKELNELRKSIEIVERVIKNYEKK